MNESIEIYCCDCDYLMDKIATTDDAIDRIMINGESINQTNLTEANMTEITRRRVIQTYITIYKCSKCGHKIQINQRYKRKVPLFKRIINKMRFW